MFQGDLAVLLGKGTPTIFGTVTDEYRNVPKKRTRNLEHFVPFTKDEKILCFEIYGKTRLKKVIAGAGNLPTIDTGAFQISDNKNLSLNKLEGDFYDIKIRDIEF